MKRIIYISIILIGISVSCKDYLDVVPDNIPTVDHSFSDRVGAEKFLATCYNYIPNAGSSYTDPAILGSDEYWLHENESFYTQLHSLNPIYLKKNLQNVNDPLFDYWANGNGGSNLFLGIRDCNIFIEKIGQVGEELTEEEMMTWIAEAKFIKAYLHYYLLKLYGPIPLMKENIPISASVEEVQVFRDPLDECVDYIVSLIDEAIPDLPLMVTNRATELGRITKPIALAIKAELLVTVASPLFNGNPDYANLVDSKGRNLFPTNYDKEKWNKAMLACQEAIDISLSAGFSFYEYQDALHPLSDTTQLVNSLRCVASEKWNSELIWANPVNVLNSIQLLAIPFFEESNLSAAVAANLAPTLNMAELFYSNHGVPIDEDTSYDFNERYDIVTAPENHKYYVLTGFQTPKLHLNREARFYANLGFDGGVWYGNGRFNDVGVGDSDEQSWIMHMKKGETSGNTSGLKFSITGYYPKKMLHIETIHNPSGGTPIRTRGTFPVIRLSDLYLLYAEAMNEYYDQPTADVYEYIDAIRAKAGLEGVQESWANYSNNPNKPNTKEGMREIIQQERLIELAFEGKRYWDLRRWKLAREYFNKTAFGWNADGSGLDFYTPRVLWSYNYSVKNYLWPIGETTLRADPNLVQNPYW